MRAFVLLTAVLGAFLPNVATAADWTAKNGDTLGIYGAPASEEYEAFINQSQECTPTGGDGRKTIAFLYCGDAAKPEKVLAAKGGVTFRGEFYALVKK
jgi:hypothetical protein